MFRLRLILEKSEGALCFRIGNAFRLVNLGVAAALALAGFLWGNLGWALSLAGVAVLGALYEESARFDKTSGQGEFRLGLLVWYRSRKFGLDAVTEVRVSTFGAASFTGLEVALVDGRVFTVENDRGKPSTQRLLAWGEELAAWLKVPLRTV